MSRIGALNRQLHICYFSEVHFKGRGYLSLGAGTMKITSKYFLKKYEIQWKQGEYVKKILACQNCLFKWNFLN